MIGSRTNTAVVSWQTRTKSRLNRNTFCDVLKQQHIMFRLAETTEIFTTNLFNQNLRYLHKELLDQEEIHNICLQACSLCEQVTLKRQTNVWKQKNYSRLHASFIP